MYQELKAQRPDQPDDMLRKFAKTYSQVTIEKIGPELKNMLSQATLKFAEETYSQAFTEQEVIELAAFYQTPTGQKMLTQLPKVMQHLANNMQNLGQTLQKSAENIIQAQEKAIMDETIRRLEAQH
ncbi:MAG: DUF2059 domain-containing protein [Proteobacteria bacterium]|nr:DUF2059 domain-containing protein [Pseudomonadota bacterium]